ncbi:MAG: UxaA family hydrolase, partial [Phycisphaerae bacterium]|nr:UxaA family hydrolase [Phycisphaerae bacterium]
MQQTVLQIDSGDDLVVALVDHAAGDVVGCNGSTLQLRTAVSAKHKFALRAVEAGERLKMYGVTVAVATEKISAGELIHTHNVRHATDGAESAG